MHIITLLLFLSAALVRGEIVELTDVETVKFPLGYDVLDNAGKLLKTMPEARSASVKAYKDVDGLRLYVSDWSWKRLQNDGTPPSWIRARNDKGDIRDQEQAEGGEPRGWFKMSLEHSNNESDYALMAVVLNELMLTAEEPSAALVSRKFLDAEDEKEEARMKRIAGFWNIKARAFFWEPLNQMWEKSVTAAHREFPNDELKRNDHLVNDYNSRIYPFFLSYYHDHYDEIAAMIQR